MEARADGHAWSEVSGTVLVSAGRTPEHEWVDRLAARLRPARLTVHRTASGTDALDVVRRGRLSFAVLDTYPHDVGGLGLLRRIRSIDAALPCVLVTERTDRRYLQRALDLKAYSVVTTPVDESILRELIAAAFRRLYERPLLF